MSQPGDGEIEAWVEFASSYSYPAAMRAEAAARAAGLKLVWRVMLLGPIFKAQGWDDSPFNLVPAKGRHMIRDLERLCADQGLPFAMPARFPAHSLLAARVAMRVEGGPALGAYVRAIFAAGFGRGEDIAAPEVVAGALAEAGLAQELIARAGLPETKAALRARSAEAEAAGVFGAPSFRIRGPAGPELFWGQDRLDQAIAWARRTAARQALQPTGGIE